MTTGDKFLSRKLLETHQDTRLQQQQTLDLQALGAESNP